MADMVRRPDTFQGGAPLEQLVAIAQRFTDQGLALEVRRFGHGNVNDTYLVTRQGSAEPLFILQRLNTRVFPRPELVMANLATITAHLQARLAKKPLPAGRRFEVPKAILTRNGGDHFRDEQGGFWRALSYIAGARTFDTVQDSGHALEVGYALGLFHRLLADLPGRRLADTLPGFHVAPAYLRYFDELLASRSTPSSPEVHHCLRFINQRRAFVPVLEDAKGKGILKERPIHGDPKVNNVMVDDGGRAVALIDLDTVKPGLLHYDLGDCLRSACNPSGEETEKWETVSFEVGTCRPLLQGYADQARAFLTEADRAYIFDALRLLAFELGLRFFSDYLAGNVYFLSRDRDHNLRRALVQFRLTESIESQAGAIKQLIRELL